MCLRQSCELYSGNKNKEVRNNAAAKHTKVAGNILKVEIKYSKTSTKA